ncbi:MAG TPA: hypothetical protein VFP21_06665 [Solirubrobacterales bacterium]|nr:hypothetical protein [Solirubrobacterales bacterium]
MPNIGGMESGSQPLTASGLLREIAIRQAFYWPFFIALICATIFDFEQGLGSAYLIWGSLLSILYASLTLHPPLSKSWGARFEVFGIVLVAWGAFLVSGMPHGAWSAITMSGACLLMVVLNLILARDAVQQIPRED